MSLRIEGLEVRVGQFVLGPLDLRVEPAEHILLAGPSGNGKTTLLRAVAGLIRPAAGRIQLGEDILDSPEHSVKPESRKIGMVFQSLALWPHLSALEHLRLVLRYRGVAKKDCDARARELLNCVQLADKGERKPSQLSGGEAQRLAIARALAGEPRLLLLDEPFAQLDPALNEEITGLLAKLHSRWQIPILQVSHDMMEILRWRGRIALMNAGRLEQLSTLEEMLEKPGSPFVSKFFGPLAAFRKAGR